MHQSVCAYVCDYQQSRRNAILMHCTPGAIYANETIVACSYNIFHLLLIAWQLFITKKLFDICVRSALRNELTSLLVKSRLGE